MTEAQADQLIEAARLSAGVAGETFSVAVYILVLVMSMFFLMILYMGYRMVR